MEKFEQFDAPGQVPEMSSPEKESGSILNELLERHPELAEIYDRRSGTNNMVINESGKIVSEGQNYENNTKMRSLIDLGNAIREQLPGVREGYVRLWRGNREGEVGRNPSYTNSLEGIALPFLRGYGGALSYVDVPIEEAKEYMSKGAVAPDSEFMLPSKIVRQVKVVGATPEQESEMKKKAKPLSEPQGNGWDSI